uniref:Uncharacterized protein n=1 Tax=Triticum urartu TaxID=4572 RepID=A0A8R7V1K1_TRIUA
MLSSDSCLAALFYFVGFGDDLMPVCSGTCISSWRASVIMKYYQGSIFGSHLFINFHVAYLIAHGHSVICTGHVRLWNFTCLSI